MELTLFLAAKNIVSHMVRDDATGISYSVVVRCINGIRFFAEQFCIIKSLLLVTLDIFSESLVP
jgi:hypothetical protein